MRSSRRVIVGVLLALGIAAGSAGGAVTASAAPAPHSAPMVYVHS